MNCEHGCCKETKSLDWALLVLRLVLGVVFVFAGYGKLFGNAPGMEAFTGMVAGLGFPLPSLFAYAAALSEFLGGLAMLAGVFTNVFSVLISIVMLVAFASVGQFSLTKGGEMLAFLAMSVAICLAGPGMYTVRRWMKKNGSEESCKTCENHTEHKH